MGSALWFQHTNPGLSVSLGQTPKGVEVDDYWLTIVDLNNIGYKDDPWVQASQVAQVLYVADPAKKTKHVVVPRKLDIIGVECIDDVEEYNQYDQMNLFTDDLAQKMNIIEAGIRIVTA